MGEIKLGGLSFLKMIKKLDSIFASKVLGINNKEIFSSDFSLKNRFQELNLEKFVRRLFCEGEVYGYFIKDNLVAALGIKESEKNSLEIIFISILPEFKGKGIWEKMISFTKLIYRMRRYKFLFPKLFSKEEESLERYFNFSYFSLDEKWSEEHKNLRGDFCR